MSPYFLGNSFAILDVKTGTSSALHSRGKPLSFITFSQTTKQVVCGGEVPGLETVDISTGRRTRFDFPTTVVTSVSTLSNGTVVANAPGSGIQLLSLDQEDASSRQPTPPLAVYPLDNGRIIATVPTTNDRVMLLEAATMLQVHSNPIRGGISVATDRNIVICASLKSRAAVRCFEEGDIGYLQMWDFYNQNQKWTVLAGELPSTGCISPAGSRFVTFHTRRWQGFVRVWNATDGSHLAWIFIGDPHAPRPLDITFDSEHQFYLYYNTYREPYVINTAFDWKTRRHFNYITRCAVQRLEGQVWGERYCLDDGREWVLCGSHKICWVPPGYIGSAPASHCWGGSSLVMVGQDGTLRKLTFLKSSL